MSLINLVNATVRLLSALEILCMDIAMLLSHIIYPVPRGISKNKKEKTKRKVIKETSRIPVWGLLSGIALLVISAGIFTTGTIPAQEQPLSVQLTLQAWDALNKGKYEHAIAHADKCINEFRSTANREQQQLEEDHVPLPPKRKVFDQEKEIILARKLLNDVAACFYIKGRSAENLGHIEEAMQAYRTASKYTYARCWDPKLKLFWAPSETASDYLSLLREGNKTATFKEIAEQHAKKIRRAVKQTELKKVSSPRSVQEAFSKKDPLLEILKGIQRDLDRCTYTTTGEPISNNDKRGILILTGKLLKLSQPTDITHLLEDVSNENAIALSNYISQLINELEE